MQPITPPTFPRPAAMTCETITREEFMRRHPAPEPIQPGEVAALARLIVIAKSDTGQSRRCANFLLAWWNATTCGGFDLTDLWAVDRQIAADMLVVAGLVARLHSYPDAYGARADFERLVAEWRPHLITT